MLFEKEEGNVWRLLKVLRRFFAFDLRSFPHYRTATEVQFYPCDKKTNMPLSPKAKGQLYDISRKGARLRTSTVRIGYEHVLFSGGWVEQSTLTLEFPQSLEGTTPFTLKGKILWYNTLPPDAEVKFEIGIEFFEPSPGEQKQLASFLQLRLNRI